MKKRFSILTQLLSTLLLLLISAAPAYAGVTTDGSIPFSGTSYRVYDQSASTTPGTPLAAVNNTGVLSSAGQEFRVRMGIDTPPTDVIYVGEGRDFGCLLTSGGLVYCWGDNTSGVYGNGTTTSVTVPTKVDFGSAFGTEKITQLSVGYDTVCAVTDAAAAYCWGSNYYGEIGDGNANFGGPDIYDRHTPFRVSDQGSLAGKGVLQISMGTDTVCALTDDHRVHCWGDNWEDAVGYDHNNPGGTVVTSPVQVDTGGGSPMNGKDIVYVGTNQYMSCALDTAGVAYCWGYNFSGLLGTNGIDDYFYQPVAVDTSGVLAGKTIKSLSVGQLYTCAIASDNLGYCWGNNGHGERGDGTTNTPRVPTAIDMSGALSGLTLKSISANVYSTCAIASDNNAYCWGANDEGYLAINQPCGGGWCSQLSPVAVYTGGLLSGKSIKSISTHYYSTCMVTTDDHLYCSGNNSSSQLADGTTTPSIEVVGGAYISYDTVAGANSYDLQYTKKTAATCEAQSTGYATVTNTSLIAYAAVTSISSGTSITTSANDPTSVPTTTPQAIYTNQGVVASPATAPAGNSSLWDYSLVDNGAEAGATYCLRMVYSGGVVLDAYTNIASVVIAGGTTTPSGPATPAAPGTPELTNTGNKIVLVVAISTLFIAGAIIVAASPRRRTYVHHLFTR